MAKNLRAKIPESDTMLIHDVNPAVLEAFQKEVGNVTIAKNVRQVAENSVGECHMSLAQPAPDEHVLFYL